MTHMYQTVFSVKRKGKSVFSASQPTVSSSHYWLTSGGPYSTNSAKKESNCHQQRVHWYPIQEGHITMLWFKNSQPCQVPIFLRQQIFPGLKKMDSCIQSTVPPAPETLLVLRKCGCTKRCKNKICSCKKSSLPCTDLCDCEDNFINRNNKVEDFDGYVRLI